MGSATADQRRPIKKKFTKKYVTQLKYNNEIFDVNYEEDDQYGLVGFQMKKAVNARMPKQNMLMPSTSGKNLNAYANLNMDFKFLRDSIRSSSRQDLNRSRDYSNGSAKRRLMRQ